jgi:hypothetical protein
MDNKTGLIKRIQIYFVTRKLKKQAKLARDYLKAMDLTMATMGMSRQLRRQYWRDFFKYSELREQLIEMGNASK